MAQQFAVQFPQNVNTTLIYDTFKEYYRPFTDKDFAGGLGGIDAFGRQRISTPENLFLPWTNRLHQDSRAISLAGC